MTRIDRRALFTSGAAAALLAATGASVTAAPKPGGILRIALPDDDAMVGELVRGAIYDGLTEIAADGLLRGELATTWHSSADARTWTFEIRDDVQFHNGSPLEPADVVASLLAQQVPGGLRDAQVVGPRSVTLDLAASNPDLPYRLSDPTLVIARNGDIDAPLNRAIGTGCYQSVDMPGNRHLRANKVHDHYKQGQAGWVDRLDIIVIPDARVRAEALQDGFVDVTVLPDPSSLKSRRDFQFHPSAQEMVLAAHANVGLPKTISRRSALDDGRIAERWWLI